jgi:hypothetical protein
MHGRNNLPFRDLDFHGQARSINGTVRHTERALEANLERALEEGRDPEEVFHTRTAQIVRMAERVASAHGYTIRWP